MNLPALGDNQVYLGVAIEVPEPLAGRLRQARTNCRDNDAHIPPHITLVAPLAMNRQNMVEVKRHIGAVVAASRPFQVHLHSTGSFRPVSPTVFVQVTKGNSECVALEAAIRSGPLAHQPAFDFCPHVTVAHQVDQVTLDQAQAALAGFDEFFLAQRVDLWQIHQTGAISRLEHYLLGSRV